MSDPADTSEPLVRLDGVTVRFGGLDALADVDLCIAPGESIALIGANGSGKSTLLNVFSGLVSPASGTVTIRPGLRVAYVRQHPPQSEWLPLTSSEVIRMGRYREQRWFGRLRPSDRDRIDDAATRMGVSDLLDVSFDRLSGGQRQRVLIAQALVQEPDLLLLDEPITGLDLPSQERILGLVEAETERGTAVVMSTHHLDEARHCDRAALLAQRLVAVGPPDDVLVADLLRTTFGPRVLGDHEGHDHSSELLVLDSHGHADEHGHGQ